MQIIDFMCANVIAGSEKYTVDRAILHMDRPHFHAPYLESCSHRNAEKSVGLEAPLYIAQDKLK